MKTLKVFLIAVVALLTFGSAKAQVVVKARIGERQHHRVVYHRPYHHRVVVVHHHYRYDRYHHRY